MTTDRNGSSVLARLMGIDRPSPPHTTNGRQRVLSESYLQNAACLSSKRVMDTNPQNGNSYLAKMTFSSSTALSVGTGKIQKAVSSVGPKGVGPQKRRKNRLRNNDIQAALGDYGSPKEIAKQITNQVERSVWHSCTEVLISEARNDKSCANQHEETMVVSTTCSSEVVNEPELSSYDSSKGTTHKALSKSSDVTSGGGTLRRNNAFSSEVAHTCFPGKSKLDNWQVGSARFLSKPTIFPSAWVPRSKERRFTLDTNWCLRPGEWNGNLSNLLIEENVGHEAKDSTFEPHSPSLDSEKLYLNGDKSSITNDTVKHEKQSTLDAILAACESFSDESAFSDEQSPDYREACESLKESCSGHLEKNYRDNSPVSLFTTSDFVSFSRESEEVIDKESTKLSAESRKSILFEDVAPAVKDIVLRHELKRTSPPGSPVSSLDGPEACRRCLSFAVEPKDLSVPQGLETGLQTKLHLIDAMSLDSGCEGPGMMISSDGGDEVGSVWCYREDVQITECTLENCEFSYLVDVLVESCTLMGNLDVDDGTWCPHGYMLDPSVFDSLEKKYGKSTVNKRSQRRLLFDRINFGLLKILQPSVGVHSWKKSVAERLVVRRSQDFIEDELWDLLVKQDEEFKSDSSDKVLCKETEWLDLEEDVDQIVQELQSLLIDGLVEEFVRTETLSS